MFDKLDRPSCFLSVRKKVLIVEEWTRGSASTMRDPDDSPPTFLKCWSAITDDFDWSAPLQEFDLTGYPAAHQHVLQSFREHFTQSDRLSSLM